MRDDWDLLCAGQLFVDVVMGGLPAGGPRLGRELHVAGHDVRPGGIANAAMAAARAGARVTMAADVGADDLGQAALRGVADAGVDVGACRHHAGWVTPLTVALTWGGDRAQVTSAPPAPAASVLSAPRLPLARVTIAHVDHRPAPWLAAAAAAGSEVLADVGWDESGRWDLGALPALTACTGITPNLDEALAYTGAATLDDALDALADVVPLVVVTLGGKGVAALDRRTGERLRVPAPCVVVRNANGAGDAFTAAFAVAGARGLPLEPRLRAGVEAAARHVATAPGRSGTGAAE